MTLFRDAENENRIFPKMRSATTVLPIAGRLWHRHHVMRKAGREVEEHGSVDVAGQAAPHITLCAMYLTNVSEEHMLRELGALNNRGRPSGAGPNWSIEIISASPHVRQVLEKAISDTAFIIPIVAAN